jgi:hypothetical protein
MQAAITPTLPNADRIGPVHIIEWQPDQRGRTMLGFLTVQWGEMIIRRITLHRIGKAYSIGVPRWRNRDNETWKDIIAFVDQDVAREFREAVLNAALDLFDAEGQSLPVMEHHG